MSDVGADRFTLDVLREGFAAITDEMFVSLQRTSQSPIIYEVLDFGVGISDARGELCLRATGSPASWARSVTRSPKPSRGALTCGPAT